MQLTFDRRGFAASCLLTKKAATAFILALTVLSISTVSAKDVSGTKVPETLSAEDSTLVLNGAGMRTRAVFKLYVAALYLAETSTDAAAITSADEPMALWLRVRSGLLTREKMIDALKSGFKQSTGGDTSAVQAEIDQMIALLDEKISKKDEFLLSYAPGTGTTVSKNGTAVGVIAGLPFKQALFGIWLSEKPVQGKLKTALLNNR